MAPSCVSHGKHLMPGCYQCRIALLEHELAAAREEIAGLKARHKRFILHEDGVYGAFILGKDNRMRFQVAQQPGAFIIYPGKNCIIKVDDRQPGEEERAPPSVTENHPRSQRINAPAAPNAPGVVQKSPVAARPRARPEGDGKAAPGLPYVCDTFRGDQGDICECGCVKIGHHVDGLGRGYCDGCGLCEGFKAKGGL